MDAQGQLRRIRLTGVITISVIALLVVAQIVIVQWRFSAQSHTRNQIMESVARTTIVTRILYQAERARTSTDGKLGIVDATSALRARQQVLNDLSGPALDTYESFLATTEELAGTPSDPIVRAHLNQLGRQLTTIYDERTAGYQAIESGRGNSARNFLVAESVVILVAIVLLHFFVARRRDETIFKTMRDLEERRQRFAAMFDNSSEMMALYDPDGNVIRANRTAVERMGYGVNAIARHFDFHTPPRERANVAKHFSLALAGKATELQTTFIDALGNEVPVVCNMSPVIVEKRVVAVVGAARDMTEHLRTEEEILRSRERFRSLFEYSNRAILAMSPDGTITHANMAFENLSGYTSEELLGESALMLVASDRRDMTLNRLKGFEKNPHTTYEGLTLTKSGQEVPVEVEISPIRVNDTLEGYFVKYRDLTRDRAIARAISGKDERMRALYRVASSNETATVQIGAALALGARGLGMHYAYVVQIDGDMLEVKHRFSKDNLLPIGFRMRLTQAIGKRLRESPRALAINDLTADVDGAALAELAERGLPWKAFVGSRVMNHDDLYGLLLFLDRSPRVWPFDDADLDFVDVMGMIVGGALARESRDLELEQQAFHDTLTGAVNRRLFEEHVHKAIARAHRLRGAIALHYIDLNGFKLINDTHGHEAGDEVLCEVVRRLNGAVRDVDVVARLGGDEFVVLETDMAGDADATVVAHRLNCAFDAPARLSNGTALQLRAAIGTSVYPRDGAVLSDLLKHADQAMYAMKRRS